MNKEQGGWAGIAGSREARITKSMKYELQNKYEICENFHLLQILNKQKKSPIKEENSLRSKNFSKSSLNTINSLKILLAGEIARGFQFEFRKQEP